MRRPIPETPGPGQESVWDYPRPPRVEHVDRRVTIDLGGERIVDTRDVVRVLETSHPPVFYVRLADVADGVVQPAAGASMCEFKGSARYFSLTAGGVTAEHAAWNYPTPFPGYETLADRLAIYPEAMEACTVDGERVIPQPGGFYGGWITSDVVGPFKGIPGSMGW